MLMLVCIQTILQQLDNQRKYLIINDANWSDPVDRVDWLKRMRYLEHRQQDREGLQYNMGIVGIFALLVLL